MVCIRTVIGVGRNRDRSGSSSSRITDRIFGGILDGTVSGIADGIAARIIGGMISESSSGSGNGSGSNGRGRDCRSGGIGLGCVLSSVSSVFRDFVTTCKPSKQRKCSSRDSLEKPSVNSS